jgi:FlgD Ig-like domain/Abnormal spindle-like microcephaly-assoc'd, ASPM-SPD-2-Hydin/HYDIN/CFA65/VesB-like, Ig-like domain
VTRGRVARAIARSAVAAWILLATASIARSTPQLVITPPAVDFGPVATGTVAEAALLFRNPGDAAVLLGGVTIADPDFAVGGPSGGIPPGTSIAPGDSLVVPLAFRPPGLGAYSATLLVSSNDPANPEQSVPLGGTGASGAVMQVAPLSFDETLDLGETVTRDLVVRNAGDLGLDWELSIRPVTGLTRASLLGVRILWDRSRNQPGTLAWSTLVGELEARGAVVDESFAPVTPSLLAAYRVFLSADLTQGWNATERTAVADWVQAGGGVLLIGDNLTSRDPYNFLLTAIGAGITMAGTWPGDAVLSGSSIKSHESTAGVTRVRVGTGPRELVPVAAPASPLLVSATGKNLAAVASVGVGRVAVVADELFDDVTIGEAEGTFDAQNRLLGNQLVDWVAGGLWLRTDLASGTVAPGDSATAQLLFDANDLRGGSYDVSLHIASNDRMTPSLDVPARLTVIGIPEIEADPASIAFGDTPAGDAAAESLRVHNTGTELLHVTGVASSSPYFTSPTAGFDVAAGDSALLTVGFVPDSIGAFSGTLTISSDAGGDPELAIPLTGRGVVNCGAPCVAPSLRPVDVQGSHGFSFWLDVLLTGNPQPVGSLGFDLHFDPSHLVSLDSVRTTSPLTTLEANTIAPGIVRVGAFGGVGSEVPANLDGSLLQLLFEVDCVSCTPGEQSDLFVSDFVDDLAGITPCCGTLTLADCPTGHGDVNDDGALSATDALCALKIFVYGGDVPPDSSCDANGECESAAADVNCSGAVSPADALAIYERVLCVAEPTPQPCFATTEPDPCGAPRESRPATALDWGVLESRDDGCSLALTADAAPGAFGLVLELPPGAAFAGVEPGRDGAPWAALEGRVGADGRLRVAGIAGEARGQRGEVARLRLQGAGGPLHVVEAVDADFAGAWQRDLPGGAVAAAGLTSVRPNPTAGALTVAYVVDGRTTRVSLTVHDVRGRVVRRLAADAAGAGPRETRWDGRGGDGRSVAAGIYFVVLRLDDRSWTRKVLLVR